MDKQITMNSCTVNEKALISYLRNKAENHNCYKMYSSLKRIVEIRDMLVLYLGDGSSWNDIVDRCEFNSALSDKRHYARCFSYSQDESVAMWMLYGGIDKLSGMIDFTQKGIRSILKTKEISVGYFDDNSFVECCRLNREQFSIYMTDVVYYKQHKGGVYIKRSDEVIKKLDNEIFDSLKGYRKAYPWNYENECRMVVSVDKSIVQAKWNVIKIDLSEMDLGKSLERVYRGPNYPLSETYGSLPSELDNTIDWSLCDRTRCKISG